LLIRWGGAKGVRCSTGYIIGKLRSKRRRSRKGLTLGSGVWIEMCV